MKTREEPVYENWKIDVKNGTIFSSKGEERYVLTLYNGSGSAKNTLVACMMNPSHAGKDEVTSDHTVNLLLRSIGKSYSKLIVVNIIPKIDSQSKNIKNIKKCSLRENLETIQTHFTQNGISGFDLYIGTGNVGAGSKSKDVKKYYIKIVNQLLKNSVNKKAFITGITRLGNPRHPSPWFMFDSTKVDKLNSSTEYSWHTDQWQN